MISNNITIWDGMNICLFPGVLPLPHLIETINKSHKENIRAISYFTETRPCTFFVCFSSCTIQGGRSSITGVANKHLIPPVKYLPIFDNQQLTNMSLNEITSIALGPGNPRIV